MTPLLENPWEYARMLKDPAYMAQREAEMWARNDPDGKIRAKLGSSNDFIPKKKKKKAKPTKIDKLFKPKTNFQGFEMKHCVYEPTIKKHVFVPKNYGKNTRDEKEIYSFCQHCNLKPCITLEHYSDMVEKAAELSIAKCLPYNTIVARLETKTKGFMRKYFGAAFTRDHGLPQCFHDTLPTLDKYMKEDEWDEESSRESDSEFEF